MQVMMTPDELAQHINKVFGHEVAQADNFGDIHIAFSGDVNGNTITLNDWLFCAGNLYAYIWYYPSAQSLEFHAYNVNDPYMGKQAHCLNSELVRQNTGRDGECETLWKFDDDNLYDILNELRVFFQLTALPVRESLNAFEDDLVI